jgi:hypothetical protein
MKAAEKLQHDEQPKSPIPEQQQETPGIEALMDPVPEFVAPDYNVK